MIPGPTPDPIQLRQQRLGQIADSLRDSDRALALLALGSAADTNRLDRWSDLDFFAIVRDGEKAAFIGDLWWLRAAAPVAWAFRNTADGWKAMYEDGVFLEFAVFEVEELASIPFASGRIVWQVDGFDASICTPRLGGHFAPADEGWLAGEVLSNLYVGLGRWRRGERLAGMRSIQVYALDALLRLEAQSGMGTAANLADPFSMDRRAEQRFPAIAPLLTHMAGGIDACPRAALVILDRLAAHVPVPEVMRREIMALAEGAGEP